MTPLEWLTVAGSVLTSSGSVLAYVLRKIEKLELKVADTAIMNARLEERLVAIDRKLDLLIAAWNSAIVSNAQDHR